MSTMVVIVSTAAVFAIGVIATASLGQADYAFYLTIVGGLILGIESVFSFFGRR